MRKLDVFSEVEKAPFSPDYDDMPLCNDKECEVCGEPLDECGDCPICDMIDEDEELDDEEIEELDFEDDGA